ncbi:MAG: glutamate ABC transporter substrate-binding protein [Acidimicrobiia bacterium]|nr:glutamate ABC transporter substrate-binding protein [Acidimicrobiia bacterium]
MNVARTNLTSTSRRRPGLRAALAGAALVLLSAACTVEADAPFDSTIVASAEEGSTTTTSQPPADPACANADPRPSLRPTSPLPPPGQMPPGSYMADIVTNDKLRAGVGQDTLLFGYLNPDNGRLEGFDVELVRLVAAAIFGEDDVDGHLDLVPIQSSERIPKLVDGSLDIVAKTMTINCVRWGSIDFSSVYYESGQRVLVARADGSGGDANPIRRIEDLAGRKVCAVEGTTSLANLTQKGVETVTAGDWTDCLVLFQQGAVLGVSTDDTILAGLAVQDPFAVVVGDAFTEEPYGLGLPKDHPEFTEFVNAVLERAREDGTWQRLYDLWLSPTLGEATPPAASYR